MSTILIVPGLHNSGPDHWQTWLQARLSGAVRIDQTDWTTPHLPRWAGAVRRALDHATGQVWIIAHSFGCLAAAHAAPNYRHKLAGLMLVAPADPEKFEVGNILPDEHLSVPSVVVASINDPWMTTVKAAYWADKWGSRLISIGAAGHINAESGYGEWIEGLEIFEHLRRSQADLPLGSLDSYMHRSRELPLRRPNAQATGKPLDWNDHKQLGLP